MNTPTRRSNRQLDHNDRCVGCGTHPCQPCLPTCPFKTGTYGPAVLLRAAASRLPDHPAAGGYDIDAALFDAALQLVGEQKADGAAEDAKQVLTGFLIDQWGPTAAATRGQVVYRHGRLTHLLDMVRSLYAAAARHDSIDFDAEPFGEFPTSVRPKVSPFAVPTRVEVAGPDQECPLWRREQPHGRYALLLGDPDDGGIAYCDTLPALEAFVVQAQAALTEASSRQQTAPTADPPPSQEYTVLGVWEWENNPVPVGVLVGAHNVTGGAMTHWDGGLWATSVHATNPDEAEQLAIAEMLSTL